MSPDQILERSRAMARAVPYVVLATTDGERASARQVQPLAVDDDLTIWVGTSPRSRKVAQLATNPRATVVVEDFEAFAYVSLMGRVTIVDDLTTRNDHWIPDLAPFFPAGAGGDDFVLLRFMPDTIEVIDFAADIAPAPYGLVPATIEHIEGTWRLGDHPRRPSEAGSG